VQAEIHVPKASSKSSSGAFIGGLANYFQLKRTERYINFLFIESDIDVAPGEMWYWDMTRALRPGKQKQQCWN
jgi:hypothetical protein